ncbi:hypothetical protein M758_1G180600 [Ceratodon purpureus]|uniref:SF4 helicase domain-containing protein n=1 Tax=Ceratodon purpureus TaxID=3225 RepID=A0A8T0J6L1_CERPU|nr:hypothetical protein KC19_1G183500 [Ceratodon purpureus]KAG0630473.1 hypothetical protein M758_1G180600 [Ceratodon purpureus]
MAFGGQVAGPAGCCSQVRGVLRLSMPVARGAYCQVRSFASPVRVPGGRPFLLLRLLPRFHGLVVPRGRDSLRYGGRGERLPLCKSPFRSVMTVAAAAEVPAVVKPVEEQLVRKGILLHSYGPGTVRGICPECKGGSSGELSLAVTISEEDDAPAVWVCHRGSCGWKGSTWKGPLAAPVGQKGNGAAYKVGKIVKRSVVKKEHTAESLRLEAVQAQVLSYFKKRGLSEATIRENNVAQHRINATDLAIAFPYVQDGKILNCKYRDANKRFWQVKESAKVLYGLDHIKGNREIVIVEGEFDKLAMYEAGIVNCVSVPDGAPAKVSGDEVPSPSEDKKYEYLWNCKDYFKDATRIILATDSDEPGQALAEELARRLGRERCWRVMWPEDENGKHYKDANEVLMSLGSEGVKDLIKNAELYPIRGLFNFRQFFREIDDYYYLRLGDERGVSTGWRGLDEIYRVVPGELTVVTGVPNSGKSEWIDALICNLNRNKKWTFGLCSMENKVREHARKLIEKHIHQPFFDAPYSRSTPRMGKEDLERGKKWLQDTFFLIRHEDEELPSVDWVLNLAKAAVMRHGIRGLVIDPYNELDHQRPGNQTETEYVSQMLTKIKRFAQHHDCHVWFVAHPRQLQVWRGEAPGLYDISGSAHFINKCDNGIVIHRNRDETMGPLDQVKVLVRKVRNKAAGTIGEATLRYNRVTGDYEDVREP